MTCIDCMARTGREDFDASACCTPWECTSPLHPAEPRALYSAVEAITKGAPGRADSPRLGGGRHHAGRLEGRRVLSMVCPDCGLVYRYQARCPDCTVRKALGLGPQTRENVIPS